MSGFRRFCGHHLFTRFSRDIALPPPATGTSIRALGAVVLLGLVFAWFNQLGVPLRATHSARVSVDEPFYLLTTVSLIEDGDIDLANNYRLRRYRAYFDHPQDLWYQSIPTADGRVLSPHNVGTSLLILPAYALGGLDAVKRFLAVLGGATVAFAALLAYRATGQLGASIAAAALVGFSAPLFVYSTQVYPESPAALLVTASLWLMLGRKPAWRSAILLALALSGLLWLGVKYAFVGAAVVVVGSWCLRHRARILLAALLSTGTAAYAWFHIATYGGLTPYAVNRLYANNSTFELVGLHVEFWNRLYRLAGLWIDGEFGLFRWAPILLLVLPALPLIARRPGPVRWMLPLVFGAALLVAVFLSITMRGWWFPGRMLIVVLPLLAIPLAEFLARIRERPWLVGLVVLLGAYGTGISLAVREATLAGRVALAVDPFALPWPPFQMLAGLYPVFTAYSALTWLLMAAWLLVIAALVGAGSRLQPRIGLKTPGEGAMPAEVPHEGRL